MQAYTHTCVHTGTGTVTGTGTNSFLGVHLKDFAMQIKAWALALTDTNV
jgi:hypothetical protein